MQRRRGVIRIKRVYDRPALSDGLRVLVDHLWPRGLAKQKARIDEWGKDLAPSDALRKWFAHDPRRWEEFERRYREELQGKMEEVKALAEQARRGTTTLLYGARDEAHNNAVVLKDVLESLFRRRCDPSSNPVGGSTAWRSRNEPPEEHVVMAKATPKKRVPAPSVPGHRNQRRAPVPGEEVVARLNELLEAERAGVEAAKGLATSPGHGFTLGELKKFGEDEGWACGDLRKAILRFGGTPSERTGDFARKLLALPTEGERLKLLARGQAWVVKRIDVLLGMGLDPDTTAFLVEMRDQHLENIDACNRRADELAAPPSVPYQGLPFARLREAHDQLFYGVWRGPTMTVRDLQRAYHELGRYLDKLSSEVGRSRLPEARTHLDKAMEAYGQVDASTYAEGALVHLDSALSYSHKALNALLRQYRVPPHDPGDFLSWYDRNVPIHDDMYIGSG